MSNIDKTADITPKSGMDLRSTAKTNATPYVQNVIPRNGDFWVRPGFGLVRQYDTSLAAGRIDTSVNATEYGLGACIGATAVRTPWDTDQILAIHPLYAFTGNFYGRQPRTISPLQDPQYGSRGTVLAGVVAIVHDLYTNRKVEIVLHEQDSQKEDLTRDYPNYATRYNEDRSTWAIPAHEPKWAIFAPMSTGIAFGTKAFNVVVCIDGMGLWTYRPVDCPIEWRRQNDSLDRPILGPFMGEQGAFSPLNLTEGLLSANDGAVYLTTSDLGIVTSQCTWNEDRVIYATDNTLWFSDPHMPQAVLADSRYVVPTTDPITCVAPLRSSVFIATSGGKCWAYQPALGSAGTAAVGSLTYISLTNGCVNNRAWCVGNEGVFFADPNGVFLWTGGVQLVWLSRPIDRLWTDPQSLEMPLTDYYQRNGNTSLQGVQLPARIDMREQMQNSRLCWDDARKALYCVCDDITLVWTTDFGWSVWYFQTHAGSGSDVMGMANIDNPTLVPVRNDLYMVGGADTRPYLDDKDSAIAVDKSCYLLKLGRGGAIDQSTCMDAPLADVWYCSLSGYIVTGDILRIAVGANQYDYTVVAGDDFTATYKAFVAQIQAVGDPEYNFIAQPTSIVAVAKVAGTGASAVVTSALAPGVGIFAATHSQVASAGDITDADLEDWRTPVNGWVKYVAGPVEPANAPAYYIGPPSIAEFRFQPPSGAAQQFEQTYWWPVAVANVSTPPSAFQLHFKFDNTRWQPICVAAATDELAVMFPSERLGSTGGYFLGAPDISHQIRVWNSGLGVPDANGDQIQIDFDGTLGAWTTAPQINAGVVGPDVLFYMGFKYIGTNNTFSLHTQLNAASIGEDDAILYAWQYGRYPTEYKALANKQQPVDWAVKSREFEVNGYQFTVRGVFITAMHMGNGTDDVVPGWLYGPLNTATSTDWRDYSGQALDFASIPPGNSAQNDILAFPRMVPATTGGDPDLMVDPLLKTFNNVATWGDATNSTKGNLLVDDPAVDTLATTDGSKGMRGSVMLHGTMNAPGEVVKLGRVEAAIKQVGLRQRWGK
jgi:hypothetical protein